MATEQEKTPPRGNDEQGPGDERPKDYIEEAKAKLANLTQSLRIYGAAIAMLAGLSLLLLALCGVARTITPVRPSLATLAIVGMGLAFTGIVILVWWERRKDEGRGHLRRDQ